MTRFAAGTSVPVERSQAEIIKNLRRYGADSWAFGEEDGAGVVCFKIHGRPVRFKLELPNKEAEEFKRSPGGRKVLGPEARLKVWEQACRQKWRALNLFILATLEAVESGLIEEDHAWMPYTLLATGETVGEHFAPTIRAAIEGGKLPRLLLPGPSGVEA